jgi:hypothetical protein
MNLIPVKPRAPIGYKHRNNITQIPGCILRIVQQANIVLSYFSFHSPKKPAAMPN